MRKKSRATRIPYTDRKFLTGKINRVPVKQVSKTLKMIHYRRVKRKRGLMIRCWKGNDAPVSKRIKKC